MLSSMGALEAVWVMGALFGVIAISPPLLHFVRARRVTNQLIRPEGEDYLPAITVLLPIRNESKVIER